MTRAYYQGVEAQRTGLKRRHNPYRTGSQEWNDWMDGWLDAYDNLACV